jgi:hypothetical protein
MNYVNCIHCTKEYTTRINLKKHVSTKHNVLTDDESVLARQTSLLNMLTDKRLPEPYLRLPECHNYIHFGFGSINDVVEHACEQYWLLNYTDYLLLIDQELELRYTQSPYDNNCTCNVEPVLDVLNDIKQYIRNNMIIDTPDVYPWLN